jgi:hypothetical protein
MLRRVVTVALLVVALALVVLSARYKGEPSDPSLVDAAVEELVPIQDATALRQSEIGIDLAAGWSADLRINGVDIPDDEERRVDPLNQVYFTPGEGRIIEELAPGRVDVTAIIWRPSEGETREAGSRIVRWSFRVA